MDTKLRPSPCRAFRQTASVFPATEVALFTSVLVCSSQMRALRGQWPARPRRLYVVDGVTRLAEADTRCLDISRANEPKARLIFYVFTVPSSTVVAVTTTIVSYRRSAADARQRG